MKTKNKCFNNKLTYKTNYVFYVFVVSILLTSCKTNVKFEKFRVDYHDTEFDSDFSRKIFGKINSIHVDRYRYYTNDTIIKHVNSDVLMNNKNKPLKLNEDIERYNTSIIFEYNKKGLLITKTTNNNLTNTRYNSIEQYEYDKNENLIQKKVYEGENCDTLKLIINYKYNSENNLIEEERNDFQSKLFSKTTEKFEYNYKKRIIYYSGYNNDVLNCIDCLQFKFNKNGIITSLISIYGSNTKNHSNFEYDKHNNITKKIQIDGKGIVTPFSNFTYKFDKLGNIIQKNEYRNNELYDRTDIKINYY